MNTKYIIGIGIVHVQVSLAVVQLLLGIVLTCIGITGHGSGYTLVGKVLGRYYLAKLWVHIR